MFKIWSKKVDKMNCLQGSADQIVFISDIWFHISCHHIQENYRRPWDHIEIRVFCSRNKSWKKNSHFCEHWMHLKRPSQTRLFTVQFTENLASMTNFASDPQVNKSGNPTAIIKGNHFTGQKFAQFWKEDPIWDYF